MCQRGHGAYLCAAVVAWVLAGAFRVDAADMPAPAPGYAVKAPARVPATPPPVSPFYVGGAISWVHHTGYLPIWSSAAEPPVADGNNVQQYGVGGKVFAGYQMYDWLRLEGEIHYLGAASFTSTYWTGFSAISINREESYALAGTLVFVSPPLSSWSIPTIVPTYLLFRIGPAYKDINQTGAAGAFHEGTLAGVVGAAIEYRITPHWFARLEYEYISTAIFGPREEVSEFRGLLYLNLGGTRNVVNVMHTPLSLTMGYNF